MSMQAILRDKNERSALRMIQSFLKAGGDPSLSFIGKFLQKHKLTLHEIMPEQFEKSAGIAPTDMSQAIINVFGGEVVSEEKPVRTPVTSVRERLAQIEAEQKAIDLDSIPF